MRKINKIVCLAALLAAPCWLGAKGLTGIVLDKTTGQPLIGAAVVVKGEANRGTSTDANGKFTLNVPDDAAEINIGFIGYRSLDLKITDTGIPLRVELETDALGIEEVVVTGQGAAVQKRRISSNVVSVGEEQLAKLPSGRIDQMLQGALPNVQINLTTGQPGTTSIIKSRGLSSAFTNSTPVIYVDGVRVDNLNTKATLSAGMANGAVTGAIGDIPMENIEKIEYVTGGAATTLYGSDAANGVIQIFTKKGGTGRTNVYAEAEIGADIATDRFYHFKRTKDLLQQNGLIQKYRVGFDGGKEEFGYSFAASMSNSDGTLIHDKNRQKKYDINAGMRAKLGKIVDYSSSFGFVSQSYGRSRNGNQGGYTGLWFTEGAASAMFGYDPDLDKLDDETYADMKALVSGAGALPIAPVQGERYQTAHTFTVKPLNNLTFKGTVGMDYRASTEKTVTTNEYLIHTLQKPEGTTDAGSISSYDRNYFGLTIDLNGQWRAQAGKNFSFITTAGFQYFSTNDHQIAYTATNVRDGATTVAGAGITRSNEYLAYLYNYGAFLQENIGFRDKLFLDLGIRTDYNTAFGDNVGWQYYPKAGLSYTLSDEPFMRWLSERNIVNNLKIRANYGIAGSYPPPFSYQKTIEIGSFLGGQTASLGNYGNPDLGPEKKHSYEAGFDMSLLRSRLTVGFTYYYARTKDALFKAPLAPSTGYDTYLANVGEIENKGIELFANLAIIRNRNWNLDISASYNTNRNVVLSTGGVAPFSIGGMSERTLQNVVEEGQPVGFIRGSKAVLNPDGSLKEVLLLQNLGTTIPTSYGNFALNLAYKNLSLYVNGNYQLGAYVHSFDRQFRFQRGLKDPTVPDKALEGKTQSEQTWNFSNFFVEKSDFLKIRTIGASYRLKFKKFLQYADISVDVHNPFTFTRCSVDPEAVLSGAQSQGGVAAGGFNYSTYSTPCQVIGTLRLTF